MATEWSVGKKLAGVFAVLAIIFLSVGALSSSLLWEASTSLSQSSGQYVPAMQLSMAFEHEILSARTQFIYQISGQRPGAEEAGWDHYRKARELAGQLRTQVRASSELTGFITPIEQMGPDLNTYEILLGRILDALKNHQNEGPLFTALLQDWTRVDERLADTAAEFNRESGELAGEASRRYVRRLDSSARTTLATCLITGILGSLLGWWLARNLNRSLAVAAGELNAAAEEFAAASEEVVQASHVLIENATEQTSSLRLASASCGQIDLLSRRGASNAHSLASAAAESRQASESGIEALGRMAGAFKEITASHDRVSEPSSISLKTSRCKPMFLPCKRHSNHAGRPKPRELFPLWRMRSAIWRSAPRGPLKRLHRRWN